MWFVWTCTRDRSLWAEVHHRDDRPLTPAGVDLAVALATDDVDEAWDVAEAVGRGAWLGHEAAA